MGRLFGFVPAGQSCGSVFSDVLASRSDVAPCRSNNVMCSASGAQRSHHITCTKSPPTEPDGNVTSVKVFQQKNSPSVFVDIFNIFL